MILYIFVSLQTDCGNQTKLRHNCKVAPTMGLFGLVTCEFIGNLSRVYRGLRKYFDYKIERGGYGGETTKSAKRS